MTCPQSHRRKEHTGVVTCTITLPLPGALNQLICRRVLQEGLNMSPWGHWEFAVPVPNSGFSNAAPRGWDDERVKGEESQGVGAKEKVQTLLA